VSYYGPEAPGPASDPWEHSATPLYDVDLGYATTPPPGREPTSSKALLFVLVAVLVVVLCGGGVTALYLIGARTKTDAGSPGPSASVTVDPNAIVPNQCMVNESTNDQPKIRIVTCTPGTLKVLSKITGTTDPERCRSVPGANEVYYYNAPDPTKSFLLCLQRVS